MNSKLRIPLCWKDAFDRELRRRRDSGAGVVTPLMAVYAREDPTVPPADGRALEALVPDAEFHWLDRSSHFIQVDSPDALDGLLRDFLEPGERRLTRTGAAPSR